MVGAQHSGSGHLRKPGVTRRATGRGPRGLPSERSAPSRGCSRCLLSGRRQRLTACLPKHWVLSATGMCCSSAACLAVKLAGQARLWARRALAGQDWPACHWRRCACQALLCCCCCCCCRCCCCRRRCLDSHYERCLCHERAAPGPDVRPLHANGPQVRHHWQPVRDAPGLPALPRQYCAPHHGGGDAGPAGALAPSPRGRGGHSEGGSALQGSLHVRLFFNRGAHAASRVPLPGCRQALHVPRPSLSWPMQEHIFQAGLPSEASAARRRLAPALCPASGTAAVRLAPDWASLLLLLLRRRLTASLKGC